MISDAGGSCAPLYSEANPGSMQLFRARIPLFNNFVVFRAPGEFVLTPAIVPLHGFEDSIQLPIEVVEPAFDDTNPGIDHQEPVADRVR